MVVKKKIKQREKDFGDIDQYDDDDITDSDDQFSDNEKIIKKKKPENFESDDEVFGLNSGDDDDDDDEDEEEEDEDDEDLMEEQQNDDMPDERAWGKKKGLYYSTDYVDQDYSTTNEKDLHKAKLEEEAARTIQKRLAEQLDDADFGLDQFIDTINDNDVKDDKEHEDVVVKTDLTKLSKREKQALMIKENPEFESLVNDSKERLIEIKEILRPFIKLSKAKKFPNTTAVNFIQVKYELALNYLTNIMFYFILKAKKISITNHPVIKRLAQYRQLLTQLENSQGDLLKKASEILAAEKNGQQLYVIESDADKTTNDMIKSNDTTTESIDNGDDDYEDEDDDIPMEDDQNKESTMQLDEISEGQRRGITYQIAKNKGLTPSRRKELRNPRVKHRLKYREAIKRRKGAVRDVRKETKRYAGELSGINATVSKSTKLR